MPTMLKILINGIIAEHLESINFDNESQIFIVIDVIGYLAFFEDDLIDFTIVDIYFVEEIQIIWFL